MNKINKIFLFLAFILMLSGIANAKQYENMLIYTTNKFVEPAGFQDKLNNFIQVLDRDNINATYYISDKSTWTDIQAELSVIAHNNNAKYIMLLGDTAIIPYSVKQVNDTLFVLSDIQYTDLDFDGFTDLNFALGRVPTDAIMNYLDTAIKIHDNGLWYNKSDEILTGMYNNSDWVSKIMNTTNLIFAGHGSPYIIQGNYFTMYSSDLPVKFNFTEKNPFIRAQFPCSVAESNAAGTWTSQLLKYGASGVMARTTTEGTPGYVEDRFYINVNSNMSFAEAYYNALHYAQSQPIYNNSIAPWHLVYFGDPSIKNKTVDIIIKPKIINNYQEDADETTCTDLTCDGNWNTSDYASNEIKYYKPENVTGAIWQIKDYCGMFNLTVPKNCFNYYADKIALSYFRGEGFGGVTYYCLSDILREIESCGDLSEEGIYWTYNANVLPIAYAGADKIMIDTDNDSTEVITLDGTESRDLDGIITLYQWYEETQLIGTGSILNKSFTAGIHNITLNVTDDNGATAIDNIMLLILKNPEIINKYQENPNQILQMDNAVDYRFFDGNWDTATGLEPSSYADYELKYVKPANAIGAKWKVKNDIETIELTLPKECWNFTDGIVLRARWGYENTAGYDCANGYNYIDVDGKLVAFLKWTILKEYTVSVEYAFEDGITWITVPTTINTTIYQENANKYFSSGSWYAYSNTKDGNWNTVGWASGGGYGYVNYTLPTGTVKAVWQVADGSYGNINYRKMTNLTIPSSCFKSNLQLRYYSKWLGKNTGSSIWQCYTGSKWQTLRNYTVIRGDDIWEEAMFFTVSKTI